VAQEHEKKAILDTLQYFFDGLDNIDAGTIKTAFHPSAWQFYVSSDGLRANPVSHWDRTCRAVAENPEHPFNKENSRKNVVYIDVTGNAAAAKVEWVFSRFMYTDYYTLMKMDGRWYIMNKIFHTTIFEDRS